MTPEHMKTTPEDIDLDRMKDDTISRQAAIDAIFGRSHEIIKMRIGNLPSEQPEIIRCRDCKCWRELPNGCQGFCDMHSTYPTLTDFCSWAERREVSE